MSTLAEFARDVATDIVGLQREISRMKTMMQSGQMHMGGMRTVTIAAGVMGVNQWGYYELVPQAGATDDLDTINNGIDGKMIGIRVNDNANTITVKDGTGNICLPDGDVDLDDVCLIMLLIYDDDSSMWVAAGGVISGAAGLGVVNFGEEETLTVAAGVVTRTATTSFFRIAAQTGTTDDLDTINGGSDGDMIVIKADTGDDITVTEAGNIQLVGTSRTLDNPADKFTCLYDDSISKWCEISQAGNA
jgi:hypothetical protein